MEEVLKWIRKNLEKLDGMAHAIDSDLVSTHRQGMMIKALDSIRRNLKKLEEQANASTGGQTQRSN